MKYQCCANSWKDKQSLVRASRLLQSHHSYLTPPLVTHNNAPLHAFCQRIPVVVASVAEAEYAAAFGGEQVLVKLTLTLTNLGHPTVTPSPIRRQRMHDWSCDFLG